MNADAAAFQLELSIIEYTHNPSYTDAHTHIHNILGRQLSPNSINLVPAKPGTVTVRLASHWSCVTDNSGITTIRAHGLRKGDEHPA